MPPFGWYYKIYHCVPQCVQFQKTSKLIIIENQGFQIALLGLAFGSFGMTSFPDLPLGGLNGLFLFAGDINFIALPVNDIVGCELE